MTATATRRRTPARRGSGEQLRAEIISAASELIGETGDAQLVSLRSVARRVGIATTSIYLHFSDIDALVLAVKLAHFDELLAVVRSAVETAPLDPVSRAKAVGHAYVRFGLENPGSYRVMFSASSRGQLVGPSGAMVGWDSFLVVRQVVAEALDRAEDDPRCHELATSLWAFVHGLVHLRTARPFFPWPDLDHQIDAMTDRVLAATS